MRTRASNGRSSIYQSRDGRWHGWVTLGVKEDGSTDRRHRTGGTRKEVTAKVRLLEKLRDAGITSDAGRVPTVGAWLAHWVENIARPGIKPKTFVGYETDVRVHATPAIGQHRLDRLQPEHIERMFAAMAAKGSSPGTVHHVRRTLVTAFNEAVARGRIPRNPAKLATVPRLPNYEIEPLTVDQARTILVAAEKERNGAAWIIAVSLGLRRGEVLALRWTDLDADQQTLTVRRALSRLSWRHGCSGTCGRKRGADCPERHGGGLVFDEPKSHSAMRTLALPLPLVATLRSHRQTQLKERMLAGTLWEDNGLVFAQPNGRPLDPDRHTAAWNEFLAMAGVRPARLHDARHTAATLLLVQGVDTRTVMALMGWSHVAMTTRYQHVVPELRREAAERMGEALWSTGTATKTATTKNRDSGNSWC